MQKWRNWEAAQESDWLVALKRESVLSPLATQSRPGAQRVEEAALGEHKEVWGGLTGRR